MITIKKLEQPIHDGDWHDKPFKWAVTGPGQEYQIFSTKTYALAYASIRRKVDTKNEAFARFVRLED